MTESTGATCQICGLRIDRLQRARPDPHAGAYIAYPCNHWHTPERAREVKREYLAAVELATVA